MRAQDRLREAQFFLEKLKATDGNGKEFRYYLSAFTSAARSITLVLQADLRARYQEKFDQWWDERKKSISDHPFSFETIRNLRNTFQKEGYKLPRVIQFTDDEDGTIIESTIDVFEDKTSTLTIHFPEIFLLSRKADETYQEFEERMLEEAKQFAFSKIVSVAKRLPKLNISDALFRISKDEVYDFEAVVSGFEKYLASMHELIDEANLLFKEEN